ncbi:MAG: hypothetical protein WC048_17560, partial [Rhizobium sp.]
ARPRNLQVSTINNRANLQKPIRQRTGLKRQFNVLEILHGRLFLLRFEKDRKSAPAADTSSFRRQ